MFLKLDCTLKKSYFISVVIPSLWLIFRLPFFSLSIFYYVSKVHIKKRTFCFIINIGLLQFFVDISVCIFSLSHFNEVFRQSLILFLFHFILDSVFNFRVLTLTIYFSCPYIYYSLLPFFVFFLKGFYELNVDKLHLLSHLLCPRLDGDLIGTIYF